MSTLDPFTTAADSGPARHVTESGPHDAPAGVATAASATGRSDGGLPVGAGGHTRPPVETGDPFGAAADPPVTRIRPRSRWRLIDWAELRQYRDLFGFLIWRQIKVRYAQSAIGVGWAILQPLFSMVVFTIVFGRLAGISSDGAPYAVFSFAALVPWMYFSNALTDGVNSLIANANMLSKVYFPRLLMPLSAVAARLVDFAIALVILGLLLAWAGCVPNAGVILMPWMIVIMVATAAGFGLWLTAFAVQYRDVKYALNFLIQILMYAAPVIYSTSEVPVRYRRLYAINPMVGVIEGFRSALLGTREMPWEFLWIGSAAAATILLTGMVYFRGKERLFADVA